MNGVRESLAKAFEGIAKKARKEGVEVEMLASGGESLSLKYAEGKLDKFQSGSTRMAGLRVVDGAAQGYASTENLSEESLERTFRQALENARLLTSKDDQIEIPLATDEALADQMTDLYRPQEISMDRKHDLARRLEELPLKKDSRIKKVPYSNFGESQGWQMVMNSRGLSRFWQSSGYSGFTYLLAEKDGSSKMDGESFFSRDFERIDLESIVDEALSRATSRLGARPMETTRIPVLIDREIASTMLEMLHDSLTAKALFEKTSLVGHRLGEKIFSDKFTLLDDPFDREGLGARPWDSEGSVSRKTTLVENGVLKSLLTNLEFARRLNLPLTAHASRSPGGEMGVGASTLVVPRGTRSRDELLRSAPRVLWITDFTGGLHAGFREQSGDFSMPAEGFLVENGTVTAPVDQFVVSGNIVEALRDLVDVGSEYSTMPSSRRVPDLMLGELSVAGAS